MGSVFHLDDALRLQCMLCIVVADRYAPSFIDPSSIQWSNMPIDGIMKFKFSFV